MLIDLSHAVGGYLYDVFVTRVDWWVFLGIVAQGIEKRLHGLRLAAGGEGGVAAVALPHPDRLDPAQPLGADRIDLRHIRATAIAHQLFRLVGKQLGLRLRYPILQRTTSFSLPHLVPLVIE